MITVITVCTTRVKAQPAAVCLSDGSFFLLWSSSISLVLDSREEVGHRNKTHEMWLYNRMLYRNAQVHRTENFFKLLLNCYYLFYTEIKMFKFN